MEDLRGIRQDSSDARPEAGIRKAREQFRMYICNNIEICYYVQQLVEEVLSAMELGGFCPLSYVTDLRMGPGGGLHVAAVLAVSSEGGAARAHAKDDLERGEEDLVLGMTYISHRSYAKEYIPFRNCPKAALGKLPSLLPMVKVML